MRVLSIGALALCIAVVPVSAQQTEAALRAAIHSADADPSPPALLAAANAARLLREYDVADGYYENAWNSSLGVINNLISSMLLQELASGGGVDGVQRRFRQVLQTVNLPPQAIGTHIGNYPNLLVGGGFDEMILTLSPDAADPLYRCTCYNLKGWAHRVAGRLDESRIYFDSLTTLQQQGTPPANPTRPRKPVVSLPVTWREPDGPRRRSACWPKRWRCRSVTPHYRLSDDVGRRLTPNSALAAIYVPW